MMLCFGRKEVLQARTKAHHQRHVTFPIHLTKVFTEAFWKCMAGLQDPETYGNLVFGILCC